VRRRHPHLDDAPRLVPALRRRSAAAAVPEPVTRRPAIDAATLARLPLGAIDRVTFYKRDEITTDLICCDVEADGQAWFFHEEVEGWDLLMTHLERLPGIL
jgi:hypothetical protein